MKTIQSAIKDSLVISVILAIYHPFHLNGETRLIFLSFIGILLINFVISTLTSYGVHKAMGKDKILSYETETKKLILQYMIDIPLLAVAIGFYVSWLMRGNLLAIWYQGDHYFLWPLASLIPGVAIVYFPLYLWNRTQLKKRYMKAEIEELQKLNALLETEQKGFQSQQTIENEIEKITINGEGRDSLVVAPHEIMYVESVGNYLSIVYFNDSELCQKRLRSPLKEVEKTLGSFPFIVRIHRAFLVNIDYITQVAGNSAGYKISMFSTGRTLPVSKANVVSFRNKIKNRDNQIPPHSKHPE